MQQLTGIDASMLYMETPSTPNHVTTVMLYDRSTAPGGQVTFDDVQRHVESRLHLARAFRQKLVRVPLDLDYPYWIEDPEFDLEFHLRHIALPSPGNRRQLFTQLGRLHARMLDTDRPLWELYMIDGLDAVDELPEGAFAIVLKIHHAAIDGVTGAEIVTAINDQTAEPQTATAATPWKPDRVPSARELLTRAGISNVTRPLRLPGVIGRTIPAIGRVRSGVRNQEFQMPPRNSPPTRFNARVSAHRVLDARVYDLEEMKRVKSAVPGATINDVVLTIVSGAMRAYLMSKGELPHDSLTAMVPISVRTEEEKGKGGNQVSTMTTTLATDVGDPLERLKVIRTATQQSKQLSNATGARTLTDLSQALPGALLGLGSRAMSRFMRPGRGAPMTNTVVTNVPGPQMPLYLAGARLVTIYGGAPTMHGAGLINVVGSYCGSVLMQFTACREMMPDPEFYAECYDSAFEELVKAT